MPRAERSRLSEDLQKESDTCKTLQGQQTTSECYQPGTPRVTVGECGWLSKGGHHFWIGWIQKRCTAAGPQVNCQLGTLGEDGDMGEKRAGVAHGGLAGDTHRPPYVCDKETHW